MTRQPRLTGRLPRPSRREVVVEPLPLTPSEPVRRTVSVGELVLYSLYEYVSGTVYSLQRESGN